MDTRWSTKKKSSPKTPLVNRKSQKMAKNSNFEPFSANYGPMSHRIWGFWTRNLYQVCGGTRWGILCSFWAPSWFLIGMKRPKIAKFTIFGHFLEMLGSPNQTGGSWGAGFVLAGPGIQMVAPECISPRGSMSFLPKCNAWLTEAALLPQRCLSYFS